MFGPFGEALSQLAKLHVLSLHAGGFNRQEPMGQRGPATDPQRPRVPKGSTKIGGMSRVSALSIASTVFLVETLVFQYLDPWGILQGSLTTRQKLYSKS